MWQKSRLFCLFLLLVLGVGCGAGVSNPQAGPPAPPTEIPAAPDLPTRIEAVTAALIPAVSSSVESSLVAPFRYLTYQTEDLWNDILNSDNGNLLLDIFGPNEDLAPISRLRKLTGDLKVILTQLQRRDSNFDCTGTGITALDDSDSLDVAFLADLGNGTAGDRLFDCFREHDNGLSVYGRSGANSDIYNIVRMQDFFVDNTTDIASRGDQREVKIIYYVIYQESTSGDVTTANIDYHVVSWGGYGGADGDFSTADDNILFKTRARITGVATFDSSDIVSDAVGDFNSIRFDRELDAEDNFANFIIQTMGRGSYGTGDYSLFEFGTNRAELNGTKEVDPTTVSAEDYDQYTNCPPSGEDLYCHPPDLQGFYCIQTPSSGANPVYASSSNCSAVEEAFAWGGTDITTVFPFTFDSQFPTLKATFENNAFFEETDLIANDGSDFEIPTY